MVRIIQNYTLYEIIGEGAYGKVYRAINKNDNKQYAVKVIEVRRFKENKKLEECTVNEINILTNIEKHQHIIKYIDMLKTPNNFYFVYQFCNGGTLEGVLKKQTKLPEKKALLIFKQLIDAFQVLNKYNIMHRDLKPDNIFFSNGVVKLGDFGFCKSLEKANMTKTMLGSPIYMAPQILRGQIYSTKADIWSLGVVLYEMLYGYCPFQSTSIPKLLEVLKQTQLQFPNDTLITQECKSLVTKLLTKDPQKRIQWMQLLSVNISNQGKITQKGKLQLVEQNSTQLFQSTKLSYSTKDLSNVQKKVQNRKHSDSQPNLVMSQGYQQNNTEQYKFLKKKQSTGGNSYEAVGLNDNLINKILSQHAKIAKYLLISIEIAKSNDNSAGLFTYLLYKKAEEQLVKLRDDIVTFNELKDLIQMFNNELKEINIELSKMNMQQNLANWKQLVKLTGEFHRNQRAFYQMIAILSNEIPKQDLSHMELQSEIRAKLN